MARTKQAPSPLPPHTPPILRTGPEAVTYHIPTTPRSPSTPIPKTTISLPPHSQWTSGLHFHARHTEYLHVVRGAICLHLDGAERVVSARAGGEIYMGSGGRKSHGVGVVICVPRYARHEWQRADAVYAAKRGRIAGVRYVPPEDVEDEVVVEEWTDPLDNDKPLFFWNLHGVLTATPDVGSLSLSQRMVKGMLGVWWVPLQLFVIFWELDNWPVLVKLRGVLGVQSRLEDLAYRHVQGPAEYAVTLVVLFLAKILGWLIGIRAVEQRRTPNELWKAYQRNGT